MGGDPVEGVLEVAAGVAPVEWFGVLAPVVLESDDPVLKFGEAGEVAWGERFALQDREVDLDLVCEHECEGESM